MEIYLKKFTPYKSKFGKYLFNTENFNYKLFLYDIYDEVEMETVGWADERLIGIFKKRKVFVAIYLENDKNIIILDKKKYIWNEKMNIIRKSCFAGFKRFAIFEGKIVLEDFYYWFYDNEDAFPGGAPLEADIFYYIKNKLDKK